MQTELTARDRSEIVANAEAPCRESWDALFIDYYQSFLWIARKIVRNDEDAKDAVQAACCSALRRFESFRGDASFRTWFTKIVINHSLMRLRDRFRDFLPLEGDPDGAERHWFNSHDMNPEEWTRYREISGFCRRLSPGLRRTYGMAAFYGCTLKEIGEQLGITVPAVKSRLHRARKELQSYFGSPAPRSAAR